ncbi:IPT/TIG domain-containing protein [Nocardia sp. NBC_00881]|uniref:IPT/TIG domain-containing protein n=1 Tax=Nocardia sp. NBC_00881 TaxID=2975995 RepID=UPI00386ED25A|nr:IPT/TIG domain-containing protein [Nocardia sp. NBC_00881]
MLTITSLSPASGPASGGNSVVVSGTGFSGVGPLTVRFGGVATTFTIDSDNRITAIAPAGTGTVPVTVTALLDGTSNPLPYTYVPVPSSSSISPSQGPTGIRVTVTGSGLSSATGVNFGGAAATSFTIVSDTQITAVVPPGSGIVPVTVTSPVGTSNPLPYIYVPFRPTITSLSPSSAPPSGFNRVVITGSGFTGPTTVRFGSTATTFTMDSPTRITAIAPPGTGTVPVTVTTAGGTSNAVNYTYLTAPTLTSVSPNSGSAGGGNTVVLTGAGFGGATAVKFGATAAISFTVLSATEIAAVVPAGAGTVAVTVTNPIGTSNSVPYTYIPAPTLSSVVPNFGPQTGGNTVILTGTNLTGVTTVSFDATPASSFTVVSGTKITAVVPARSLGPAAVTVAADGGISNAVVYTYVAAPTVISANPNSGPETGGNTVIIQGTGFTGATAVRFGATPAVSFTVGSSTEITAVAPAGTGTAAVTVTTVGGTSNPVTYTYIPAPVLGSVDPNSGPETGGNTVILTGTGFTEVTAVEFGPTAAISFTVNSDTQITAIAPAGIGTADVTVTATGGTSNPVPYTYIPAPTLTSVVPDSGPETGGNTVTLFGTDLAGVTAVHFGATPAASFTVVSGTEITAVAAAGAGTVAVSVTTSGGASNPVSYTYVPAPTLNSAFPSSGPGRGGNTVVLTGTNLTGASAVRFGVNTVIAFTVVSDTQISALVPAGTGIVDVTVVTAGGTSSPVAYTYVPAPTLVSIVPGSGPETGGNTVTLTGTNLTGATAVSFNGTPAISFTVVSDTTITAVAPAGTTGPVVVTVTTVGGTSNAVVYTYVAAPTLISTTPNSGPETGGNTVILKGTGFTGTSAVRFGAIPATSFTVVSDTEINAVAPAGTGRRDVTVTATGGTSNPVTYTYVPAPVLGSVVPSSGPETGGNTVVLTGTKLAGASAVRFGVNTVIAFTVVSDTQISVLVPAGTGIVDVTVVTAGGTSSPVAYTYVPAPTLVSIVPGSGPETGGNTVTLTGTNLTGATAVSFNGTPAISFTVVSDTTITAVVPTRAGSADVTVTTAGGLSNPVTYTYLPAPTLTSVVSGSGPEIGGNTVTLRGADLTGATAVHFDGTSATSFSVVSDAEISAVVPAGTGTVTVTVTATGGDSNGVAYTYVPAPTLASVVPDSGPETGGNTVILTGTGFTGTTAVNFAASTAVSFTVASDSQITAVAPAGTGSVDVTVTTAGGASNPVVYSYVPAPALAAVVSDAGPETGGNPVTITGSGLATATTVIFGQAPAPSFTVVSDSEITAVAPAGTGTAAVTVETVGGASDGALYKFVPAPTLASIDPGAGPETGGNTVTLTGGGFTGAHAVDFGPMVAISFAVVSDTEISAVVPAGTGTVDVTITTPGGTSNGVRYAYAPAPTVTTVLPDSGPETGGNTVILTGSGFTDATAVDFGANPAVAFTVVSDSQITAVVPAGSGSVNATVTTAGGTSDRVVYAYVPRPAITSAVPRFGPETGGNTVTLTGTNFTGTTAVRFGVTPATSFTVVSDTQITAVAPARTGTAAITVTTRGGISNGVLYGFTPAPALTAVAPRFGPVTGGNTVTLTGTNFTRATAVRFGATLATAFTVVSDTQITAVAPARTGTVNVTVSSPGGISNGVPYGFTPAPALTAVAPRFGPETGGNTITLTGTNFTRATAVRFGATLATAFTVVSDTQITAVAPARTGTVNVTVSSPGGISNGVPYGFTPAPTLATVAPRFGPEAGGNTVTLTGTNLTRTVAVRFGATPATSFTVVSDTQITAVAPARTGIAAITVTTTGGRSNGVLYGFTPAPTLDTIAPDSGPETGGNTVTLTGTNLTRTTAVLFGATPATSFTVVSDTEITAVAPAGTGTIAVTLTTPGGTSNGVSYTYVPAPVLAAIVPGSGPETGGDTVSLTGTNLTGTTAVAFGATPATSFTVVSDIEITAVAPAGTGTVDVTATTIGGSSNGVSYAYVLVPTLDSVVPNAGPVEGGNTVILTGANLIGVTSVVFGVTAATSFTVDSGTQISAVVPAGTGTVPVTVVSPTGTSNEVLYTYGGAPALRAVVSDLGPEAGGNTVVLQGENFTGTLAVDFGATAATSFTVDSDTQITAVVPAGTATVPVAVTNQFGVSNEVPYNYLGGPALTSVAPNQGPTSGGNTVTLTGTGFTGASAVDFDGTAAMSFTVVSDTEIRAVTPAGTGTVAVTITTPGGTSNGVSYTYVPASTLTTVVPDSGPQTGGNTVILTGVGFISATAVNFGARTAVSFAVVSDTEISAVVPAGTGSVNVTVTTAGGVSNPLAYTYVPAPTVATIVPGSGPESGGNTVTLTGTNFTGATGVNFGSTPAASFTVVSDTEMRAVSPAGTDTAAVTVTTIGGTSDGVLYTFVPAPTITSVVPGSGPEAGGNTVSVIGTGFTGATAVEFGATPATSFAVVSDGVITAVAPAGNGTAAVTVTAVGGDSNPATYTYVPAPTLTTVVPGSGPEAGGNTVILTGTGFSSATAVNFGASAAVSFAVVSDTEISAVVPAGTGSVNVTVTTAGGVGNGVPYTYVPAPTVATIVLGSGPETGGNTVTLTGTNFTSATAVNFGSTPAILFTVVSDTEISVVAPAGTDTAAITVTTIGGASDGALYTYIPAPTLDSVNPDSGPENGGNTVTLSGTGFTGASAVDFDGTAAVSFTVGSDTEISAVAPAGTGATAVTVTTTGGTSNAVSYTYVPAPTLASVVPDSGPETGGNTVTLTGTGFARTTSVNFGASTAVSYTVASDIEISAIVPAGIGSVNATVTSAGGVSNPVTYLYIPAPTLASVVPDSGPETGGNSVVLTGAGFTGASAVDFGGTAAVSFTVVSDTEIRAIAPSGTGTTAVTVKTVGGASDAALYTFVPAPTLASVDPDSGPETGGNTVSLSGAGFTGASAVDFGGAAAVSFTVVSDTEISAVAPAGTGTAAVTVTTPGGTTNAVSYTYVAAPTLISVAPDSGPEAGGNTVILTGTNFTSATTLRFGALAAAFTVVSDSEISATTPPGSGTVGVTVTTAGGTSNPVLYANVPPPTLASVVPNAGPTTGGNTVTLTGTGFVDVISVTFGANAASFAVVSDAQISAVVPAGAAGTATITVTATGGASNGVSYTYVPAPTIAAVIPNSGPTTGGNTVTIDGTGFTGATAVHFGATPAASYTVVSDTRITAVVPARTTGAVTVTATTTGGTSNGVVYTYAAVPTLTSVAPNSGSTTGGTTLTLTLTGTNLTGTTAVRFGATAAVSFTLVSASQISAMAPAGTAGPVAVTITTTGGTSNGVVYTYAAVPTLTSVSPNSGPVAGGTTVTLTGTGFTGASAVRFGATPATFTVISETQVSAVVPAGTDGSVAVTVTTAGGTSNGVLYTYIPAPTLVELIPDLGPTFGGNTITLAGTRFTGATAVRFGTTAATSFTVISDTRIRATVPAGTGIVAVTVTTAGGTSNGVPYTYLHTSTFTTTVNPSSE